jgi:aquaporin Z
MSLSKRALAELIGTFWLVLGGVGSAVLAAKFSGGPALGNIGIGFLGVALAFGLTVVTMAYAFGPISGAHVNPAVSFGLWAGRRFPTLDLVAYVVAQVVGAIAAAAVLYAIASGAKGFSLSAGFGSNGYATHSPGGYSLASVIVTEVVLTFFFVLVIHGATDRRAPKALAPLAIGLTLTLIHLISIPVDNTSVNPARSLAPAIFVGGWAISQVWVFIVFPLAGGALAGLLYRFVFEVGELPTDMPTAGAPRESEI